MVTLETEIDLAAPLQSVWAVIPDFSSFSEWNPQFVVMGSPELGARLVIHANVPDSSDSYYTFRVKVVELEPERQLAWRGEVPGPLSGYHYWYLSGSGENTHLIHGEEFYGLYVGINGYRHMMPFRPSYEAVNEALSRRLVSHG